MEKDAESSGNIISTITVDTHIKNIGMFLLVFLTGSKATVAGQYSSQNRCIKTDYI